MQPGRRLSNILAGAVTIAILLVLLKKVNLSRIEISGFYFLPAVLVLASTLAAYILRAYTYRIILKDEKVLPVGMLFNITGLYNFLSSLFPFGIGHLSYPYFVGKYACVSLSHSLNSLLLYNFVRVILLLVLMTISSAKGVQFHHFFSVFEQTIWLAYTILALIIVSILIGLVIRYGRRQRLPGHDNRFSKAGAGFFAFIRGDLRLLPSVVILAIIIILFNSFNIYFSYRTFGINLSIYATFFLFSLSNLSSFLPIHALSSIGSFELVNSLGMVLLGFESNQAIQISFAVHFLGLAIQSLFAVACYYALRKFYLLEAYASENSRKHT